MIVMTEVGSEVQLAIPKHLILLAEKALDTLIGSAVTTGVRMSNNALVGLLYLTASRRSPLSPRAL